VEGIGNVLAGMWGSLGSATYSNNVGVIGVTKVSMLCFYLQMAMFH